AADAKTLGQCTLVEHHLLGRRINVHLENGFLQGLVGLVLEARLRRNPDDCDICISHDRRRLALFTCGHDSSPPCWRRLLSRRNTRIFLAYQIPECQDARVFAESAQYFVLTILSLAY